MVRTAISWQHKIGYHLWLQIEMVVLFLVAPLLIAVFMPATMMFAGLFSFTALGLFMLWRTPGFFWSELLSRERSVSWVLVGSVAFGTGVSGFLVLSFFAPDALFQLFAHPQVLLMIVVFYPFLSALPQELIFRSLFFRRYKKVLPSGGGAIFLNAAAFSFAHLMYWSWIVLILTFIGGVFFAYSYKSRGNFVEAFLAHSVAGIVLFGMGMGEYFYSGNVVRPF